MRGRHRVRHRHRRRSPVTASVLSLVWPGLGHAYARMRRRALIFAVPPLVVAVGAIGFVAADPAMAALSLLAPATALAAVGLLVVLAGWWILAIVDAWRQTRPDGRLILDRALPLVVLLIVIVSGLNLTAATYIKSFGDAGSRIFTGQRPDGSSEIDDILGGGPRPSPGATALPGDTNGDGVFDWNDDGWVDDDQEVVAGDTNGDGVVDENDEPVPTDPNGGEPSPSLEPGPTPPPIDEFSIGELPRDGPINVLFVGLDSGLGRTHSLSDTLMVASYNPARGTVTMISIPRDMGRLPLYTGGVYPQRINTFLNYARGNPGLFPEGPIAALMKEVGYVLGTTIHFYAATNLDGLPRAVDAVGGVTITVTNPVHSVKSNYHVEPGTYHWNGAEALLYARVRYGSSDFARARRQQQVIRALAQRVRDPWVASRLPAVVDALSEVVRTNAPRDQVPTLLRILDRANDATTEQVVLSPPRYARRAADVGFYMIEPDMAAIRDLSMRAFGSHSRYR